MSTLWAFIIRNQAKLKIFIMTHPTDHAQTLRLALLEDERCRKILTHVRDLALPDCWIGAGFVRNTIWTLLSGDKMAETTSDVDVIWFDPMQAKSELDTQTEQRLMSVEPTVPWSVKNQARMHTRNGDEPYISCVHALSFWPETATAVAARLTETGEIEVLAPFGLQDLFDGVLRPTPRFKQDKLNLFEKRWREKGWLEQWPFLRIVVA